MRFTWAQIPAASNSGKRLRAAIKKTVGAPVLRARGTRQGRAGGQQQSNRARRQPQSLHGNDATAEPASQATGKRNSMRYTSTPVIET